MIKKDIFEYIEEKIIPLYDNFDGGHKQDHAYKVINSSLAIAKDYDVNVNMVYVIAAFHDVGLKFDRQTHQIHSARVLLEDNNLKKFFNEDELLIMSQAVEDHRASNDYEPRSIYGRIVAEADRDINYETIIKRTVQYSLSKYPSFTKEEHINRVVNHVKEKYGENGYLKLYLNTKENSDGLEEIRNKLKNLNQFIEDIKKYL